jgi:hypothetical protein
MSTLRTNQIQTTGGAILVDSTGGIIQVVQRLSNAYGEISTPAMQNNNNDVQVPDYYVDITTKRTNSRILVMMKNKLYGPNQQHQYVDIKRSVSGGGFTSLVTTYRTDATIDTFSGIHANAGGAFEGDYWTQIIDTPNVAAGTTLRYQQFYGSWAGGIMDYGGWDTLQNVNARGLIVMQAMEIVA